MQQKVVIILIIVGICCCCLSLGSGVWYWSTLNQFPRCQTTWSYYDKDLKPIKSNVAGCLQDTKPWCATNDTYVSGGKENLTWKYTEDPNDPQCLKNWNYYNSNGNLIKGSIANITKENDTKNWCAMSGAYIASKGIDGKSWIYC